MTKIMHFMKGDGIGQEYVVIADDEASAKEAETEAAADGYQLSDSIEVEEDFTGFPTNRPLVV